MSGFAIGPDDEPATLVGLLDELLDQGVHVAGDLVVGLADVELVRVALRLLVASEDTVQRTGRAVPGPAEPGGPVGGGPSSGRIGPTPAGSPSPSRSSPPRTRRPPDQPAGRTVRNELGGRRPGDDLRDRDREQLTDGVAKLVLTVVAVIHDLVERQAIRRVEAGSLTDDQVERLGIALEALEERMADVRDAFGLTDEELDLDLGPLGRLR
jgi:hypothetical protein